MRYRGHGWGADSLVARYGYDVLGRRIARRVYWSPLPGAEARETRYLYQGGQVVAETDAAGAFKWKYTWGPGTDNLVGLQDSTGTQFYVVQDQLGSVRGLVRRDGTWIMSQRFTPAGQLLARDSVGGHQWPKGLHVGWTGRETDPETGLSFHRARYYSPELRRWTQEDPIGYGGGGNLYAYVGGAVLEGGIRVGCLRRWGISGSGSRSRETFSGGASCRCAWCSAPTQGIGMSRSGRSGLMSRPSRCGNGTGRRSREEVRI
ncbi:MAG: RHS repeat-associated core domain-containing protein [Gemmatimonadetes bacterium]|nr:RHS repeat-associated core domain-containing protein [Gemmatimonadota bacterium]